MQGSGHILDIISHLRDSLNQQLEVKYLRLRKTLGGSEVVWNHWFVARVHHGSVNPGKGNLSK